MNAMDRFRPILMAMALLWISLVGGVSLSAAGELHPLLLQKAALEKKFGIKTLECFPFLENIGFTENQKDYIQHCLEGVERLQIALAEVTDLDIHTLGISTRFLRTGGFHTALVPWDAKKNELVDFFSRNLSKPEQKKFLDKVHALKRSIRERLKVRDLYCSQKISNLQCLQGYESLATLALEGLKRKTHWNQIVVSDSPGFPKDIQVLTLGYADPPDKMRELLRRDVFLEWNERKKIYEEIESLYGKDFKKRLQLANLICSRQLSQEQCLEGASHFHEASADSVLKRRTWGIVTLDKYNTLILDDADASIRYDLSPMEIVRHFSRKPTRRMATEKNVLSEKLEKKTLNNPTRLRTVCDLTGLSSVLCARGLQTFIRFVKAHRNFRADPPWTELMFVDGFNLSRVNFALNSPVRHSYVYIDANSGDREFEEHLMRFGQLQEEEESF